MHDAVFDGGFIGFDIKGRDRIHMPQKCDFGLWVKEDFDVVALSDGFGVMR